MTTGFGVAAAAAFAGAVPAATMLPRRRRAGIVRLAAAEASQA